MSTTASTTQDFVETIAKEVASRVDVAVESWLAQVQDALTDPQLTTLGRMNAAKDVLDRYRRLTGKAWLRSRQAA